MRGQALLINKQSIMLFCAMLVVSGIFFSFDSYGIGYAGSESRHGEIAYNVWRYNSVKMNPARARARGIKQQEIGRLVNVSEIDHEQFGSPTRYPSMLDTVGYGVLIGLLWKITNSLSFTDIKVFQIFFYSLLMFFIYSLAAVLFNNRNVALACGVAQLFYLPLVGQTILVLRDVWDYYGSLLLLWGLGMYLWKRISLRTFAGVSVGVALCQHIRPTVFIHLLAVTFFLCLYALFKRSEWSFALKALSVIWLVNGIVFWAPFTMYNKTAYGRYFVSPVSHGLLEGLGEFPNKWGFVCSDERMASFIQGKYNVSYGTPAFDDRAKEEFNRAMKENPWHFIFSALRRIPQLILPALPVPRFSAEEGKEFSYQQRFSSLWERIETRFLHAFSSFEAFYHFFGRQCMRLLLVLGYVGLVCAIFNGHFWASALIFIGGIMPAYHLLVFHVVDRALIAPYGFFPFFIGYAVYELLKKK